jgi:hypothetical protein
MTGMAGLSRLARVLCVVGFGAMVWSVLGTAVQPAVMYVDEHGNEIDHYRFEHDLLWIGLGAVAAAVALSVAGAVVRRRAR